MGNGLSQEQEINNKVIDARFRKLRVWQQAYEIALLIYSETVSFPKAEEFGLKSQIRRSAISIASNIAEGYMRQHRKEYIHFLTIALGSVGELETQIVLAKDLHFIPLNNYYEIENSLERVIAGLTKLFKVLSKAK